MSFMFHSFSWFYAVSIISRILGGFGEGMIVNASYSIPTSQLPLERDVYIGLFQVFDVLGVLAGMVYICIFSSFIEFPGVMYITLV
mmetsp:Transcript_33323/g.24061  ORF Transcript_33323/g.24061 Transcript_33323/m.24061 type:complete len:86 (-) Transcript_33323:928-1185(-)|eukprot:CAMPEP_0116881592 /NCGR_PEP_ID=MMETSP0463-20121206/13671_1 /TAXON_ID=181622 /ORGANISM="Strombidinopsis sp, Strain SopsisLIS2011" /LENGTH=85 /DNA_ID=CAMNT_0004533625 /DNA_START=371 /DNA_END=628 /DNA_ORIENTATION=+